MSPERATRRHALRLCGLGLAGVAAGCSGGESRSTTRPDTSARETPTTVAIGEQATSENGQAVTISAPQVRKIIYTPDTYPTYHLSPAASSEAQFLTVGVETDDTAVTDLPLTPVIDDEPADGDTYRLRFGDGDQSRIGFRIPVGDVQHGVLEWRPREDERYRWEIPTSILADLEVSPRFEVESFTVPESIERDEQFTGSVTVQNVGERDGRFLATVESLGSASVPIAGPFSFEVAAGETVTHQFSGRTEIDSGEKNAVLDWGLGSRQESFTVD